MKLFQLLTLIRSCLPRSVVAKKASSPGEVDRLNFMLRASSMLQMKKGVQHTRKQTVQ
jgi:hypothetical protein